MPRDSVIHPKAEGATDGGSTLSTSVRPGAKLSELSRVDCLRLLATSRFGRVAVKLGENVPVIRPLNYIFDERTHCVAFRTTPGSKLHALLRAKEAAFEVDAIDPATRSGWSVIISGVTEEVTDPSEVRRLETLGLEVWAPGHRTHWTRIRARTVSGRRIVGLPSGGSSEA